MAKICATICGVCVALFTIGGIFCVTLIWTGINYAKSHHHPASAIELASTNFTVVNITQSRLSAKWDLSIRITEDLPGYYICLLGDDIQVSILYKNVILTTSSPQKCMDLRYNNVSTVVVSDEDISGFIGKEIMEDIKDKKEVQFGFRFFLTEGREKKTVVMSYNCDDVTLRFEPNSETKATLFGKHPQCKEF